MGAKHTTNEEILAAARAAEAKLALIAKTRRPTAAESAEAQKAYAAAAKVSGNTEVSDG